MLKDRAVLVALHVPSLSSTKQDKEVTEEIIKLHGAAKDSGKFQKLIFPKEAVKPFTTLANEIRKWHRTNTLPWMDDGRRILPTKHHSTYGTGVRGFDVKMAVVGEVFLLGFDDMVAARKVDLNGMFKESDYPSKEDLKEKFIITPTFDPIPSGDDFRVSIADEEMRYATDERVRKAEKAAQNHLWHRLADRIRPLTGKLPDPEATLRNLREIINLIPSMSISEDEKLEQFRIEAQENLACWTPESLTSSKSAKVGTAEEARRILDRMGAWMTPVTTPDAEAEAVAA